jgi:hypothetical protein
MGGNIGKVLAGVALACLFVAGVSADAAAQGRGHGGGGGGRSPGGGGPPAGVGVDRGLGRSSDASNGRADSGRGNASDRSNGRSDAGLERARMQQNNARDADKELRDHPGQAAALHTTVNDLRDGYRAALAANPNLKFGQYVAATRLAANLGATHPNVTRDRILAGLAGGRSIGQTLRDLGLGSQEAKDAERRANREIKESRRH